MCTKRKPSTEQAFSSSADRTAEAGKLVESSKAHFIWVKCSLVLLRLAIYSERDKNKGNSTDTIASGGFPELEFF